MKTPTIAYASDIHFEFYRAEPNWLPKLPQSPDILVLAGDIDVGDHAIRSIKRIATELPETDIVFVAGNHEFYGEHIDQQIERYREAFANSPRIHFLENDKLELYGLTFLGCTLWTGFDAFKEFDYYESSFMAQHRIRDFRLIRKSLYGEETVLQASDVEAYFQESNQWLQTELSKTDPGSTVVVTHFPPHSELLHGKIKKDLLSNYFVASCDDLIETYQPKLWVYGHNHWSDHKQVGVTKLVSNQLGYPSEAVGIPEFEYVV